MSNNLKEMLFSMLMTKFKHENSKVKEQVVKDPKMLHIHLNTWDKY